MRQSREMAERIEVGQLGEVVGREDQGLEVGQGGGQAGLDAVGPVARQEEAAQPGAEGEVAEGGDVIVGEVDGVGLVLEMGEGSQFQRVGLPFRFPKAYLSIVGKRLEKGGKRDRAGRGEEGRRVLKGGENIPLQHPGSQWLGFCGLCIARIDINVARSSKSVASALFSVTHL